jgi:predicted nucleic acid-binding protein
MKRLLFVDTNIWLDFYRVRTEAGLALLNHLDAIRQHLIMTYQVEMEFKKHRQEAILEGFKALQSPGSVPRPGLFSDAKSAKALQKDLKNAEKRVNTLKNRLRRALNRPSVHDPVYKVCQRCFHKEDEYSLTRTAKTKNILRRLAFRRFICGYPPRKKNDTSIGDALNWEWIIRCAIEHSAEIHIASRDSDYGVTFEGKSYLNDQLLQEFKERVSQKRFIQLHAKLSDALKHFEVKITPEEESEEDQIIFNESISHPSLSQQEKMEELIRKLFGDPPQTEPENS